ncbi:MAG: hypothetical protein IKP31_05690 [Lachnospiraceae bacterium]|nr:hypothetical protein [Lachnospiraceae bacterium]
MSNNHRFVMKLLVVMAATVMIFLAAPAEAEAKVYMLPDGTVFDSDFYAAAYPEMRAGYANGKYPERLLWHYLTYGVKEGRIPSLYSLNNPTPATMSTPNIYAPGTYPAVVPVNMLYPYTPYIY